MDSQPNTFHRSYGGTPEKAAKLILACGTPAVQGLHLAIPLSAKRFAHSFRRGPESTERFPRPWANQAMLRWSQLVELESGLPSGPTGLPKFIKEVRGCTIPLLSVAQTLLPSKHHFPFFLSTFLFVFSLPICSPTLVIISCGPRCPNR